MLRHPRSSALIRRLRLGLAILALVGAAIGGPGPVAAIDPCYGYDLCLHLKLVGMFGSDGNGLVTSSPAGIDCRYVAGSPDPATTCDHYFHTNLVASMTVTLHGVADAGSLVGCSTEPTYVPACDGSITVSASADEYYYMTFRLDPTVTVGNDEVPGGFVLSSPSGIQCSPFGGTCSEAWLSGTSITLTALPGAGYVFAGWQGYCAGRASSCSFVLSGNVDTTAKFASTATPPPTQPPTPTPGPRSTPSPPPVGATPAPTARPTPAASSKVGPAASPMGEPGGVGPGSATGSPPAGSGVSAGIDGTASSPAPGGSVGAVAAGDAGHAATTSGPGFGTAADATRTGQAASADLGPVIAPVIAAGLIVALGILGAAAMLRGRRRAGP